VLLWISDSAGKRFKVPVAKDQRNGISYWQAFVVGIAQAFAVAPGVSRSGSTIATGLLVGVKRENMAQFSFLMVLIPIIGEQGLDMLKVALGSETFGGGVGVLPLALGFVAAFFSGLFACKVMIALVKKAKLLWFALYCILVASLILILA
jgi:undecaprenyl-diphosphatase